VKELHQILTAPVLTEKAISKMLDLKTGVYTYTFRVALDANKFEIKSAVQRRFEVEVESVNTLIVPGKKRRLRYKEGKRSNWKKAVVRLKAGHKIAEFEGA
jgi:large subunit ribosomal protein L23